MAFREEEAANVNLIMDMIREEGLKLKEGESMPINLSVQLYRRPTIGDFIMGMFKSASNALTKIFASIFDKEFK